MTDGTPLVPTATVSEAICDYLKADLQLHSMLTGVDGKTRIYPKDMRAVGWDSTPEVFSRDRLMLLSLCVDDAGGGPRPDAPHVLLSNVYYIWAFSNRGLQGHREIEAVLTRCFAILHQQVINAGFVSCGVRLGTQDSDDDAFDRMPIQITGDYLTGQ